MKKNIFVATLCLIMFGLCNFMNAQDNEVTYAELFKSFKQTDKGNCVIVAYIKASIAILGKDSVFKSLNWDTKTLRVVPWDSEQEIVVTRAEVDSARVYSKFKLMDSTNARFKEIFNFAQLCYAVAAKRRAAIDKVDYIASLKALDEGSSALNAYHYLGLTEHHVAVKRRLSRTKGYDGLVVYNWKHAAYAAYGKMDLWGKTKRIRKLYYYGRVRILSPNPKLLVKQNNPA